MGRAADQGTVGQQSALARRFEAFQGDGDTAQKGTETSLIERFLYPRLGPGQMWEAAAERVVAAGGTIYLRHRVVGIHRTGHARRCGRRAG